MEINIHGCKKKNIRNLITHKNDIPNHILVDQLVTAKMLFNLFLNSYSEFLIVSKNFKFAFNFFPNDKGDPF